MLKLAKITEKHLEQAEGALMRTQELIDSAEFAQQMQEAVGALATGNELLKKLNEEMSVEDVEDILAESDEAIAVRREIDEAFAASFGAEYENDDDILAELEELETQNAEEALLEADKAPVDVQMEDDDEEIPMDIDEKPEKVAALA